VTAASARRSAGGVAWLREAGWLDRKRALAYSKIVMLVFASVFGAWIYAGHGEIDPYGRPIGTDFVSFWAASSLALDGTPAAAYDPAQHWAAEARAVGGAAIPYYAWFYPPVFLVLVLPLALVPYGWSLAIWLAVTGAGYAATMRRLLPGREALYAAFGFPAAFVNVMHGQNAFLSTALLGGGILLLDRRPILAGLLLGGLAYKPQLACLVPIALVASGQWTALAAAAASVGLLSAAAVVLFGHDTFAAFLASTGLARQMLEEGLVDWYKMQSIFAAARLLGLSLMTAYAAQGVVALGAVVAVVIAWRGRASIAAKGAVLAAASLLFSPLVLDYDLVLLAIPMAFVVRRGASGGFLPWEKAFLGLSWLLPLASRGIAEFTGLGDAPFVCGFMLMATLRRAQREASDSLRERI
jgi:alpha-1,2-mannosyltransferase